MQDQHGSEPGFECQTCHSRYTRLDHLTRHIRSHTQERPFVCGECDKAFARADLLKRHAIGHESNEPNAKRLKTSTKPRASRACIACAKSKLRCDGEENCSRCAKRGIDCIYKPGQHGNVSKVSPDIVEEPNTTDGSFAAETSTVHWQDMPQSLPHFTDGLDIGGDIFAADQGPLTHASGGTSASNIDFDDTYLADFLRGVIQPGDDAYEGLYEPRDFLDFTHTNSFEYLDHTFADNRFSNAVDGEVPNASAARSGYATPNRNNNGLSLSAQAYEESLWLWEPQKGDHSTADRAHISQPVENLIAEEIAGLGSIPFPFMGQIARDKVLAAVLGTCDSSMVATVVSSFPSAELLTVLIYRWMVHHQAQTDSWFHFARFDPNAEPPELLICMSAAGAALSKNNRIRRLGYALQEAARSANSTTFESDNRNIRRLKPYQSLALVLDVGIWSGDRRKAEIAESFSHCLATMIRRGGYLANVPQSSSLPTPEDDAETLEKKWVAWIEAESLRRMMAHLMIRDSQTSASLLIPPLVSFAEVGCELPWPKHIWQARSATDWAAAMSTVDHSSPRFSLRSCLHELPPAKDCERSIDVSLSILVIAHAFWGFCWQHRQLDAINRQTWDDRNNPSSMLSSSIKQIANQKLQQFRLMAGEWQPFHPEAVLTCERVLMNLYVSLEEVQILAGKRGEKEARQTYKALKNWAESSDSRQAIWHAGQLLRAAAMFPAGQLRDAAAIAVYHAGLTFWAYAILTQSEKQRLRESQSEHVVLNQEANAGLERFVMLGRGVPILRHDTITVPIREAKKVMHFIVELLHRNNGTRGPEESPPLIENLTKLMRSLGNAARSIRGL